MGDLLAQHDPDTLRALLLSSHYRRPIDYGPTRLEEISRGLQAFTHFFERYERLTGRSFYELSAPIREPEGRYALAIAEVEEHRSRFLEAMDDDFNTGGAFGELFELLRSLNRFADARKLDTEKDPSALAEFHAGVLALKELTQILGLFRVPPTAAKASDDALSASLLDLLVKLRTQVRKEKNFALADQIRKDLAALGVVLVDRPDGTGWKIESKPV
jgi:cysteinyl-tRNA synthetase